MAKLFDRAGQQIASFVGGVGTGNLNLGSALPADTTNGDIITLAAAGAVSGDSINYLIQEGSKWEIGTGALSGTSPTFVLARGPVKTWDGTTAGTNTALTFTTAAKVYCVPANSVGNTWAALQTFGGNLVIGSSGATFAWTGSAVTSDKFLWVNARGIGLGGGGSPQVELLGGGSNVLAIGSSTNPQTFNIYGSTDSNSGTPTTNYSRLSIKHNGSSSGATIATEAGGGTLSAGPLKFLASSYSFRNVADTAAADITAGNFNGTLNGPILAGGVSYCPGISINNLTTANNIGFAFSSTTGSNGTVDTMLYRNAAGVVEVNNGTAGTYRAIKAAAFLQAQGTLTSVTNTTAWDAQAKQSATLTLSENSTLSLATNQVAGTTYCLIVKQDATGGRTLNLTAYKFPGGTQPTLSTAANAVDILTFVSDGTNMYGVAQKAFA